MKGIFQKTTLFVFALLAWGCDQVPKGIIPQKQMEQILYDVHLAEGVMEEYPSHYRDLPAKQGLMAGVFAKNNITKMEFDSSLVYYSGHLDKYMKVYEAVNKRLQTDRDTIAEYLARYERSLLSPEGDSVDVWKLADQLLLSGDMNRFASSFELKGDSNYRADNRLVWEMRTFDIDSVTPLLFSIGYQLYNGNTFGHDTILYAPGYYHYEMQTPMLVDKDKIYGSFSVLNALDHPDKVVYIDDIRLMRYRVQPAADSLSITK